MGMIDADKLIEWLENELEDLKVEIHLAETEDEKTQTHLDGWLEGVKSVRRMVKRMKAQASQQETGYRIRQGGYGERG